MTRSSATAAPDAPEVTVLMASYNHVGYVRSAIESALGQDYPNLGIVIVDDASSDGTFELIQQMQEEHPGRIVALRNEVNRGATPSFNIALRQCTGKYIAFLGGDDLFLPGKIAAQVAWFEARPERVLCGHQAEVFYEDGSAAPHPFQRRLRRGKGAASVIRNGAFAACSIMVRADAIPEHGFEESLPLASDYMLWVEVLAGGGEFGYIPGTYARYRRHSANISGNVPRLVEDGVRALELIARRYPQYAESCRRAYGRFVHFPTGRHLLAQGDRKAARAELLKAIRLEPGFVRPWLELPKTLR